MKHKVSAEVETGGVLEMPHLPGSFLGSQAHCQVWWPCSTTPGSLAAVLHLVLLLCSFPPAGRVDLGLSLGLTLADLGLSSEVPPPSLWCSRLVEGKDVQMKVDLVTVECWPSPANHLATSWSNCANHTVAHF